MKQVAQEIADQEEVSLKTKQYVLDQYEKKLETWRKDLQPVADLRELTFSEVMLIVLKLHPTNREDSKEITRNLLLYLAEHKIATSYEIQDAIGVSYPTLLERLKILRVMNLVRRESRMFYLATPRLYEFVKTYMDHLN